MIEDGWFGQSMWDPETAEDYILLAAMNPNIANELPQSGFRFWKAAKYRRDLDSGTREVRPASKKNDQADHLYHADHGV